MIALPNWLLATAAAANGVALVLALLLLARERPKAPRRGSSHAQAPQEDALYEALLREAERAESEQARWSAAELRLRQDLERFRAAARWGRG